MKGLPRSLARGAPQMQEVVKANIPLRAVPLTTTGATGVGFGSVVIGGLPQGNIRIMAAVAYIQLTKLSAGTIATFDGDYAIGSAPTADATLSGAEVDIIASTALNPATAGVSPMVRSANVPTGILDNTDGSLELNLNVLMDDASVSADGQLFTVSGVVHLAYVVLGDD